MLGASAPGDASASSSQETVVCGSRVTVQPGLGRPSVTGFSTIVAVATAGAGELDPVVGEALVTTVDGVGGTSEPPADVPEPALAHAASTSVAATQIVMSRTSKPSPVNFGEAHRL